MKPSVTVGVLATVIVVSGCTTLRVDPVCRHKALYAAVTLGERYPVRVRIGDTEIAVRKHVQVQVKINGEWKWVSVVGDSVYVSQQDDFRPTKDLSPDEFYKEVFEGKLKEDAK